MSLHENGKGNKCRRGRRTSPTIRKMRRMGGLIVPYPGHAEETAKRLASKLVESGRREVEVGKGTTSAAVSDSNRNALSLICGCELSATHRIEVGIDTSVTREVVEKKVGDSGDVVRVGVGDTTRTQASSVESALASLSTD
jgi:hypothetical protein